MVDPPPPASQGTALVPPPSPQNSVSTTGSPITFDLNHLLTEHRNSFQPSQPGVTSNDEDEPDAAPEPDLTEVPDSELNPTDRHVREVMRTKRKENLKVSDRIKILFGFVWNCSNTSKSPHLRDYFHHSLGNHPLMESIHSTLMRRRLRKHDCKGDFLASELFKLYFLLKKSDEARDNDNDSLPRRAVRKEADALLKFRGYITAIIQRHDDEKIVEKSKKDKKVSSAPPRSNPMFHDDFARSRPKWRNEIFSTPCPACGHNSLVKYDTDKSIYNEVSKLRGSYTAANIQYAKLVPSVQATTKKPKHPNYPKQRMICMCVHYRCEDIHSGKGCPNCTKTASLNMALSFNPMTGTNDCPLCQCKCTLFFNKSDFHKLKAQEEVQRDKARDTKAEEMRKAAGK